MIPLLYSDITFRQALSELRMGEGPLAETITCTVYEEINGKFNLTLKYPEKGVLSDYLITGNLIRAKPGNAYENAQFFRIKTVSKPINGIKSVFADHISYELNGIPIPPFSYTNRPSYFMTKLPSLSPLEGDYFFFSAESGFNDIITFESQVPMTMRTALLSPDYSLTSLTGGEMLFDNKKVTLVKQRGAATEVEIYYGRELIDYNEARSIENLYTHIVGYALKENENGETECITTEPFAIQIANPLLKRTQKTLIHDFTSEFAENEDVTPAGIAAKVNEYCEKNQLVNPLVTITVSIANLRKCPEYQSLIDALPLIGLGDNIKVHVPWNSEGAKLRIVSTTYDVLAETYTDLSIGERKKDLTDTITSIKRNLQGKSTQITQLELKKAKVKDYFIERGTSGNWIYRKSASGDAECWGVFNTTYSTSVVEGGNYAVTSDVIRVDLPENLFTKSPIVELTPMGGGYPAVVIANVYNTHFTFTIRTEWAVTNMPIWLQVRCIGIWK